MVDPCVLRRCLSCLLLDILWLGTIFAAEVNQNTALHEAIRRKDTNSVNRLVAEGADINSLDQSQATPLHIAADIGHESFVRLLLSKGAYVSSVGGRLQATPLHYAAAAGHTKIVEMLLAAHADINAWGSQGFRPIHYAVQNGHLMVVKLLLQNNADIHVKTDQGMTPLMFAVYYHHRGIEYLLISKGAKPDILCAVIQDDVGRVAALVAQDPSLANINVPTEDCWTPLFWAVSGNSLNIVKVLINAGADIEDQTQQVTPLYWAVRKGYTRIAKYLIERGANVNATMGRGVTALHSVSNKACAQLLVDRGANVNARDSQGRTPLHSILSIEGHWITLNDLRTRRSTTDIEALKRLAMEEQAAIAEIFLEHDADILARDNNGYTPLQMAEIAGYKGLVDQINTYLEKRKQNP